MSPLPTPTAPTLATPAIAAPDAAPDSVGVDSGARQARAAASSEHAASVVAPPAQLYWPAARFYWGVLDASALKAGQTRRMWGGRKKRDEQLGYLFEGVLPGVSIEELHTIYARVHGEQKYIACALPRQVLEEYVASGGTSVTLTPTIMPACVPRGVNANQLNLLTGAFAPAPIMRLRRRGFMVLIVLAVIVSSLLTFGLERRAHGQRQALAALAAAEDEILSSVVGEESPGGLPPRLRLTAELRQLEQTRGGIRGGGMPVAELESASAAVDLAALIAHWPSDLHMQTESIMTVPPSVTIRGTVPTMDDAQTFANAFLPLKEQGWTLQQPRSETRADGVFITLRLQKASSTSPLRTPPSSPSGATP